MWAYIDAVDRSFCLATTPYIVFESCVPNKQSVPNQQSVFPILVILIWTIYDLYLMMASRYLKLSTASRGFPAIWMSNSSHLWNINHAPPGRPGPPFLIDAPSGCLILWRHTIRLVNCCDVQQTMQDQPGYSGSQA